jgi:hypothetical protein
MATKSKKAIKFTMTIKYTNIVHCKTLQNLPKSGNRGVHPSREKDCECKVLRNGGEKNFLMFLSFFSLESFQQLLRISWWPKKDSPRQGDQIGQIFILLGDCLHTLGSFWKLQRSPNVLGYFLKEKSYAIPFTKHDFGDLFTNSSGHPGPGFSAKLTAGPLLNAISG